MKNWELSYCKNAKAHHNKLYGHGDYLIFECHTHIIIWGTAACSHNNIMDETKLSGMSSTIDLWTVKAGCSDIC